MDNLEKEKLFLDIGGPELKAYRYIYAPQATESGIKFGASRNKYHGNIVQINKSGSDYSIIYIRLTKPNFKKGMPHSKKVVFEQIGSLDEIRVVLRDSFLN